MSALRIDKARWPLLLTVFNGEQSDTEFDAYMRDMDAIYDAGQPFIAASLMLRYRPDMAQLRRLAEWTGRRRDAVARACLGTAIIAPSPGFRFLFSTLLMMQRLPVPYCVVSTPDEASDWIEKHLEGQSRRPPRDLREYLREQLRLEQTAR